MSKGIQTKYDGITVSYFDKEDVKSKTIFGKSIPVVYFRVFYKRKKVTLKSRLFEYYVNNGIDFTEIREGLINREVFYIDMILDELFKSNGTFELPTFKNYYTDLSINAFDLLELNALNKLVVTLFDEFKLQTLSRFLENIESTKSLNLTMLLIEEIDAFFSEKYGSHHEKLISEINEHLSFLPTFLNRLAEHNDDFNSRWHRHIRIDNYGYLPKILLYTSYTDGTLSLTAKYHSSNPEKYNLNKAKLQLQVEKVKNMRH